MKNLLNLLLIICFISFINAYIRPCYFTNWAQYRRGRAKYVPEDYIPGLCTHILFAFGWISEDFTAKAYDLADLPTEWEPAGLYARVNLLKKIDPKLKTLLSFGGWTFGTRIFQNMCRTATNRKVFIDSVLKFVTKHNFDGIDIDWEYPNGKDDKFSFNNFLKELYDAVNAFTTLHNPRLLITAAVSANPKIILNGYDIPTISKYLNFVLLMSYDFHGSWEKITGINAPLYAQKNELNKHKEWNLVDAANNWVQMGMPKSKIIIGIPTYGRGWTLSEPNFKRGIGAPGYASKPTKYVRSSGTAAYYEFCEMLADGAQRFFDRTTKTPFLVYNDQWFSYDDVESIKYKTDWIKANNFGGAFVWTLDFDDFNGKCSQNNGTKYPLISTIAAELSTNNYYIKKNSNFLTTQTSLNSNNLIQSFKLTNNSTIFLTIKTTTLSTTTDKFICYKNGFFIDPKSCYKFYRCFNSIAYHFECPNKLKFNLNTLQCDYSHLVNCE